MSEPGELERELERLRVRLAEAEETLRAIRQGEVDALVVDSPDGPRVYTLKGADEPYRILVERMQDGAATLSAEGTILYGNRGFAQMIGRSLEQVIGAPLRSFVEAGEQVALEATLRAGRSGSVRRELMLRRADGTVFPALLSLGPLPAEDDGAAVSMVASDLSEQRRGEAIAMAERFLRSILEQATEPIVVCDARGRITHASRAALALGAGDAIGLPAAEAFRFEVPDRTGQRRSARRMLANQFARALRGQSVAGVEVGWTGPHGEHRDYLLSAGPLHDGRDVVVGCIAMLVEISERKRAEEHQQVLLAELSHRVKNTIATVRSIAAQTMRNAPSLDAFAPMFNGRLGALAVAHGTLTQAGWGEVELGDLVHRTLAPYQSGGHDHIWIAGASARLPARQVVPMTLMLHELATNAAKYGALSTPEGRLQVTWTIDSAGPARSVCLRWLESGGPRVRPPEGKGFGTALIERSMAYEFDGAAQIDYQPEGVRCELTFPLTSAGGNLLQEAETSAERLRSDLESRTAL